MLNTFLWKKGKPFRSDVTRAEMLGALHERKDSLLWVDLEAPDEFESDCLVEIFNFHDLAVEDCLTDLPQPKIDDYEEYLFLVMHAVRMNDEGELATTELDIFLGRNYVVTFHREKIKSLEYLREAVQRRPDSILGRGADMLVHHILDQLVDSYQPVLNKYDDKIELLEEELFNHPSQDFLETIMQVKQDIFKFRRLVLPQRETMNYLTRTPTAFIKSKNRIYFRDIYDHLYKVYGTIEGFQEAITSILQAYFSYSSHKLNEVVKRMTVLATLTMPSVIIASVYGMNFKNMPELDHPYGYFGSILLMAATSIGMLVWMKIKKWI